MLFYCNLLTNAYLFRIDSADMPKLNRILHEFPHVQVTYNGLKVKFNIFNSYGNQYSIKNGQHFKSFSSNLFIFFQNQKYTLLIKM